MRGPENLCRSPGGRANKFPETTRVCFQCLRAFSGKRFTVTNFDRKSSSVRSRIGMGMRFTRSSSGGRSPGFSSSPAGCAETGDGEWPFSRSSARNAASSSAEGPAGASSGSGALCAPSASDRRSWTAATASSSVRGSPFSVLRFSTAFVSRFFLSRRRGRSPQAWRSP